MVLSINTKLGRLLRDFINNLDLTSMRHFLVVKSVTICVIFTLALTHKWELQPMDINNSFLNVSLHEYIYMVQPPGFE